VRTEWPRGTNRRLPLLLPSRRGQQRASRLQHSSFNVVDAAGRIEKRVVFSTPRSRAAALHGSTSSTCSTSSTSNPTITATTSPPATTTTATAVAAAANDLAAESDGGSNALALLALPEWETTTSPSTGLALLSAQWTRTVHFSQQMQDLGNKHVRLD
jgi:hypothetical protein